MSSLGDALDALADTLAAEAGAAVTYTRGRHSATVTAVPGLRRGRRDQPGDGRRAPLDSEPLDFLIRAADLVLNGAVVTPARGDRVTFGGRGYDVAPRDGEPCYRPCDPAGVLLRVHTIRKV